MRPGTADLPLFRVSPSWGGADSCSSMIGRRRVRVEGYGPGWCPRVLIWVWDGRVSKNLLIPAMKCAEVSRGKLYQVS
jgi:hypothetical protein